jgi:hypothetical protein
MRILPGLAMSAAILLTGVGLATAAPAAGAAPAAAAAPAVHRDAREQVPPALLGMWKADTAASTYPGAKPRNALRSFQYTADGKVLVTFMTLGATGAYTTGHWAAQVDGTPGIEYHSAAGSIPYNTVNFKKVDERNFTLGVYRNGVQNLSATYELSADGQTLTYRYDQTVIIYRRWNLAD